MLVAGVIEDTLSDAGELELVSTQLVVVARVTTAVRSRGLSRQFFLVSVFATVSVSATASVSATISVSATASVSATVSVSVKSVSVAKNVKYPYPFAKKKPGG